MISTSRSNGGYRRVVASGRRVDSESGARTGTSLTGPRRAQHRWPAEVSGWVGRVGTGCRGGVGGRCLLRADDDRTGRRRDRADGPELGRLARPLGARLLGGGGGAEDVHPAADGAGPHLRGGVRRGGGESAAEADREHQHGDREPGQLSQ
ncbi:hypothetical protein GCM10027614_42910 [Micromonospora vulcania]